jgi:hypothetical protein
MKSSVKSKDVSEVATCLMLVSWFGLLFSPEEEGGISLGNVG